MTKRRILFLCTGNSCRSQMAEAIWRDLAGSSWEVVSAGSDPAGFVHPLAIATLDEIGLPTAGLYSKGLSDLDGRFDLAITVCDNAQRHCPITPVADRTLHWPFDDPADATGTEAEQRHVFRNVRDQIHNAIAHFLAATGWQS